RPRLVMGVHPVVPGASRQYLADDRALFPARDDRQQPLRRRPGSAQLELRGRRFAMKGNVLGFDPDTNTGAISGYDGQRYDFVTVDWRGASRPRRGDVVDFQAVDQRATEIFLITPVYVQPGFWQFYFSPVGRISRSQYWLRFWLPYLGVYITLDLIAEIAGKGSSLAIAISITTSILSLITFWPWI